RCEQIDEGDPRVPVTKELEGRKVAAVREVVRINHHRNCMLCHAPASLSSLGAQEQAARSSEPATETIRLVNQIISADTHGSQTVRPETQTTMVTSIPLGATLTSQVPLPNERLPSIFDDYYRKIG